MALFLWREIKMLNNIPYFTTPVGRLPFHMLVKLRSPSKRIPISNLIQYYTFCKRIETDVTM